MHMLFASSCNWIHVHHRLIEYFERQCIGHAFERRVGAGRGIGLRVTRDMKAGELLMCVPALAMVFGPRGSIPENEVDGVMVLEAEKETTCLLHVHCPLPIPSFATAQPNMHT